MTTDKVRVGVIGVGQIGKHHLSNYSKIPNAEVVAVADVNEAEARRVAEMYNIPNVYTDFRQLLQRDDIVAVDVCLHNNFHAPVTIAALEAGKHVFCEKPMAGAYIDAEHMFKTAQTTGQKLHIQCQNIFQNYAKAAKVLIDGGHLGKVYHARSVGHRRRGRPYVDGYGSPTFVQKQNSAGGALYDMGVYHINTILFLLGNPQVLRISGKTYQETPMDPRRQANSGYNVEELGLGFIRLADGLTIDIIEAWAVHMDKFDGSMVFGSEGGIRLDPFGYYRTLADIDFDLSTPLDRFDWRQHTVHEVGDVYDGPQQHWIAALQGRVALIPMDEIALNTMLISEGIYLSDRLGREVTAEEVREMSVSTAITL
ncbi:MAG: Gfo/Idh/MocA family oxidoreductase [Caldilineaceae bacterium]|nr:Gfo/Idh/MocA family oxidoreductase [Caldilineaceae bacterium]